MQVQTLMRIVGADFYTGIPDSQLRPLCDCLMNTYGIDNKHHVIAANEGNCVALAAGYHLATGKVPVVYMQNSGQGNMINPVASLLNEKVYAIPMIFIIGWRGQPGTYDEPQHVYQGEITLKLLEDLGIATCIITKEMNTQALQEAMNAFLPLLASGKNVAFVVEKNALSYDRQGEYQNSYAMSRESVVEHITRVTERDPVISTTGKLSRELFEIREKNGQGHYLDFLTVGSMGHSSSIALGVAINKPNTKIWCIDGDGAALMHMGAMALIAAVSPHNLVHVVINNGAHETVGGMPTVANGIDMAKIANACGYSVCMCVDTYDELDEALNKAKELQSLCFIEVKCAIGARDDLGRPTTTAIENKKGFMKWLEAHT